MTGVRRRTSRWTSSARSPSPQDAARIEELLAGEQPGFWTSVRADAEVTARFRGEHHEFRSGLDALVQVARLAWITDAFFAQVCFRARVACRQARIPLLPAVLHRLAVITGQVAIGDYAVVRPGLYLPHGQVVVDGLTLVGEGVVLRPFVTLGLVDGHIFGPVIGDHARIGTGAKVVGPVRVGERANVGANAVVIADVPDGATAVGVPARVLPQAEAEAEGQASP